MKKNLSSLIVSVFMLFVHGTAHEITFADPQTRETIVLKLPDHFEAGWKEINRQMSKK